MTDEAEPFLPARARKSSWRLAMVLVALLGVGIVTLIGQLTVPRRPWWAPDRENSYDVFDVGHDHQALSTAAEWVGHLTIPTVLRVLTLVVAVVLWRRGLRATAVWWAVTMVVSGAVAIVVRELVARPRPHWPDSGPLVDGYTFPSGHATNAAVFAGCVVVVTWPHLRRAWRAVVVVAGIAFFVTVGASRLLLGVHSVSDILSAWALAASLLLGMFAVGATPAVRRLMPSVRDVRDVRDDRDDRDDRGVSSDRDDRAVRAVRGEKDS